MIKFCHYLHIQKQSGTFIRRIQRKLMEYKEKLCFLFLSYHMCNSHYYKKVLFCRKLFLNSITSSLSH